MFCSEKSLVLAPKFRLQIPVWAKTHPCSESQDKLAKKQWLNSDLGQRWEENKKWHHIKEFINEPFSPVHFHCKGSFHVKCPTSTLSSDVWPHEFDHFMYLKCSAHTGGSSCSPEGAPSAEIPVQIPVCPDGRNFPGAEGIHGEHPCCPGENNEDSSGTAAAHRAGGGAFILITLFSLLAMNTNSVTSVCHACFHWKLFVQPCRRSGESFPEGMLAGLELFL